MLRNLPESFFTFFQPKKAVLVNRPYACQASGKYYFEVNLIEGRLDQR